MIPSSLTRFGKKLKYLSTIHLPLVGKSTIASALFFFLFFHHNVSMFSKGHLQMQGAPYELCMEHCTRTIVCWANCCVSKRMRGLNFLDPKETMNILLCKWIFLAIEPGELNLKLLLRACMNRTWPSKHTKWALDILWFFVQRLHSIAGFRILN